jgi:aminocarboxymuconate-semialdehyde decarboxylase
MFPLVSMVLDTSDIFAVNRRFRLEIKHISTLNSIKGVIMGTSGSGNGIDDPALVPLFEEIEKTGLTIFLHPHYGIGGGILKSADNDTGHVLPLALGFTFETTISVSKFLLTGIFDKLPDLKMLLAHSGGTLPFLAGRLDSCVAHDPTCCEKLKHEPSYYLKKLFYDSVCYNESALKCLLSFTSVNNVMFGTDNPFFPPLKAVSKPWKSVGMYFYRTVTP